jgi:NAD+ synthase
MQIRDFIKKTVEGAGRKSVVVGLSGGIDSAVSCTLAVEALGKSGVLALMMPDSRVTPEIDTNDAIELAKKLDIQYRVIDIAPIHSTYMTFLKPSKLPMGNLLARIRMGILYYHANLDNRLVLGTEDKTEAFLGYFTRYGDSGTDLEPIEDLYKTDVRMMGRILGVPDQIVRKESSPALWRGQTAEGEIHMSYDKVDNVIRVINGQNAMIDVYEVAKKARVKVDTVRLVINMNKYTEFKRHNPPVCRLT